MVVTEVFVSSTCVCVCVRGCVCVCVCVYDSLLRYLCRQNAITGTSTPTIYLSPELHVTAFLSLHLRYQCRHIKMCMYRYINESISFHLRYQCRRPRLFMIHRFLNTYREREKERKKERERKKESVCITTMLIVCVCVCVCV
jgi:hypothetical protein